MKKLRSLLCRIIPFPSWRQRAVSLYSIVQDICRGRILKRGILEWYRKNETIIACERNGVKYVLASHCRVITPTIFQDGAFETTEMHKFFKVSEHFHGRRNGVFLDVGANIGSGTLTAAQHPMVTHVYAFEPNPLNYALLSANVCLNALNEKVTTVNVAVGNESGTIDFSLCKENSGDHRIVTTDEKNAVCELNEDDRKTISVKIITLNDYFRRAADFPHISYLWVDTQGFEYFVLSGADQVIRKDTSVVVEFWPYQMARNNSLEKCLSYIKAHFTHFLIMQDVNTDSTLTPTIIGELDVLCQKLLGAEEGASCGYVDLFLLNFAEKEGLTT